MGETIRRVAFCPHCGNEAPQRLLLVQDYAALGIHSDGSSQRDIPCTYFVAACETCDEILVYCAEPNQGDFTEKNFHRTDLVWPPSSIWPQNAVPQTVADCYSEAARIKKVAPNAFAVQIRRALEAICDDRGVSRGPLQRRLKELAQRGDIPPVLAEMTDVLRVLGNLGAHANQQRVNLLHVWAIDDFFRAVVEYVYVAPSKLADFKKRLEKSVPKQPDGTPEKTDV